MHYCHIRLRRQTISRFACPDSSLPGNCSLPWLPRLQCRTTPASLFCSQDSHAVRVATDMGVLQLHGVGAEPDVFMGIKVSRSKVRQTGFLIDLLAGEEEVGMVVRAIPLVLEHLASRQEHQPLGDM